MLLLLLLLLLLAEEEAFGWACVVDLGERWADDGKGGLLTVAVDEKNLGARHWVEARRALGVGSRGGMVVVDRWSWLLDGFRW